MARDVTVLIQGPVSHPEVDWKSCVHSVREQLPGSTIKTVMWKSDLDSEIIPDVSLNDPGPISRNGVHSNLSRQVFALSRGLEEVRTPFVLKFRPDFLLENSMFVSGRENWPRKYIRALNVFSINPERSGHYFWVSDMIQFGFTEDLITFWNPEQDVGEQFKSPSVSRYLSLASPWGASPIAKSPEQFLTSSWLRSQGYEIEEWGDRSIKQNRRNFLASVRATESHFEIVHWTTSGLTIPSRFRLVNPDLYYSRSGSRMPFITSAFTRWLSPDYRLTRLGGLLMFLSPKLYYLVRQRWLHYRHKS